MLILARATVRRRLTPSSLAAWIIAILALMGVASAASAQRTDVVTLRNGDVLTGEIRELDLGMLRYSTDAAGTISLEWPEIVSVVSDKLLEMQLRSGLRVFGSLESSDPGNVIIVQPEQRIEVALVDIVSIAAIRSTFWDRLDGLISVGISVEKANSQTSFTGDVDLHFRAPSFDVNLDGQAFQQTRDDVDPTRRYNIGLNGIWRFSDRWGVAALTRLESSDELDLDLRGTYAAGLSRLLSETNHVRWAFLTGLGGNSERFDGEEAATSVELVEATTLEWFTFGDHESTLSTSLSVYPNLTDFGRIRVNFDIRARREMVLDFFISLSAFNKYDSRPPNQVDGESTNDYGLTFGIGYDF